MTLRDAIAASAARGGGSFILASQEDSDGYTCRVYKRKDGVDLPLPLFHPGGPFGPYEGIPQGLLQYAPYGDEIFDAIAESLAKPPRNQSNFYLAPNFPKELASSFFGYGLSLNNWRPGY